MDRPERGFREEGADRAGVKSVGLGDWRDVADAAMGGSVGRCHSCTSNLTPVVVEVETPAGAAAGVEGSALSWCLRDEQDVPVSAGIGEAGAAARTRVRRLLVFAAVEPTVSALTWRFAEAVEAGEEEKDRLVWDGVSKAPSRRSEGARV